MSSSVPAQRYDHIDAMRAIAALLVVWLHSSEDIATDGSLWFHDLALGANVGGIGVMLFFMISGFVIPASLRTGRPRGEELRAFVIRRFFRLYPVYWASMLYALFGMWWLWGRHIDLPTILANLTMAPQPFGFAPIEGLYWTLLTELVFYIFCAGLFALGLLHRPVALSLISLALAVAFIGGYLNGVREALGPLRFLFYTELPMHLSLMFASALLRQWYDGDLKPGLSRSTLIFTLVLWLLVAVWIGTYVDSSGRLALVYVNIEGSRAVGVILFLIFCFWLKPSWPPLAALGRVSYSLYVLHRPLIAILVWLAASYSPALGWLHADQFASFALVLVLATGVAALGYLYIELPFIGIGRRLSRPGVPSPAPAPPRLHA